MITGMSDLSWQRMQLGAGMLIANLILPKAADAALLRHIVKEAKATGKGVLGAMRSGGGFRCTPKIRRLEEDYRTPSRDSIAVDGWRVRLTGTMLEFTPENTAAFAVCADVKQRHGLTIIEPCMTQGMEQFIDTLCWVGDTACGYVLIELTNALNSDAELTIDDTTEGAMSFTFEAHLDGTQYTDNAPCRIILLEGRSDTKEQANGCE